MIEGFLGLAVLAGLLTLFVIYRTWAGDGL